MTPGADHDGLPDTMHVDGSLDPPALRYELHSIEPVTLARADGCRPPGHPTLPLFTESRPVKNDAEA